MGEGPEEKQQVRNRLFFVPVYISMQIIINLTPLKHQHKEQTQAQGIKSHTQSLYKEMPALFF